MQAWATLLTQPNYLAGVRVLRASLERSGSPHPLVVMVTRNIDPADRALLESDGCLVREVDPIRPAGGGRANYANARFAEVWTKLAAWTLTDYERIVFLDADMLVTQNMNELFALELADDEIAACHACRCNPNQIPSYPASWTPENCFYTHHGASAGAVRSNPDEDYLNGGFLVLTPSDRLFAAMMAELAAVDDLGRYQFAEQDFLNEHFRGRWLPLSYVYNALKTLPFQHPAVWDASAVKNIHYIIDKPWQAQLDVGSRYHALHQLWWDVADEVLNERSSRELACESS